MRRAGPRNAFTSRAAKQYSTFTFTPRSQMRTSSLKLSQVSGFPFQLGTFDCAKSSSRPIFQFYTDRRLLVPGELRAPPEPLFPESSAAASRIAARPRRGSEAPRRGRRVWQGGSARTLRTPGPRSASTAPAFQGIGFGRAAAGGRAAALQRRSATTVGIRWAPRTPVAKPPDTRAARFAGRTRAARSVAYAWSRRLRRAARRRMNLCNMGATSYVLTG